MSGTAENYGRDALSKREREILRELVTGKNNAQIASDLFISRETVKKHVSSIFGKMGTANRVQAAVEAVRRGLD
jgi:DNA-binding NarL/FixJ family response regulator